jgi:hypothetical protein
MDRFSYNGTMRIKRCTNCDEGKAGGKPNAGGNIWEALPIKTIKNREQYGLFSDRTPGAPRGGRSPPYEVADCGDRKEQREKVVVVLKSSEQQFRHSRDEYRTSAMILTFSPHKIGLERRYIKNRLQRDSCSVIANFCQQRSRQLNQVVLNVDSV